MSIVTAQQRPGAPAQPPAAQAPRPLPFSQPLLDDKGHIRDDAFIPAPPLSGADRIYADIDGARMKAIVNDVVAVSRRSRDDGNKYWGRIAGTKYEAMTGDLIEARFKSFGLVDLQRKEFALPPT